MRVSTPAAAILLMATAAFSVAGVRFAGTIPVQGTKVRNSKQSPAPAKPITVAYCELLSNPDPYERKVIRVKAIYSSHFEKSAIRDPNCNREFLWTWVDFDEQNATCAENAETTRREGFSNCDTTGTSALYRVKSPGSPNEVLLQSAENFGFRFRRQLSHPFVSYDSGAVNEKKCRRSPDPQGSGRQLLDLVYRYAKSVQIFPAIIHRLR